MIVQEDRKGPVYCAGHTYTHTQWFAMYFLLWEGWMKIEYDSQEADGNVC